MIFNKVTCLFIMQLKSSLNHLVFSLSCSCSISSSVPCICLHLFSTSPLDLDETSGALVIFSVTDLSKESASSMPKPLENRQRHNYQHKVNNSNIDNKYKQHQQEHKQHKQQKQVQNKQHQEHHKLHQ